MTPETLETAWASLALAGSPYQLEATEVDRAADVWVALDHSGGRHLLVRVPDGATLPTSQTQGLRAVVARHRIAGRADASYVDLSCASEAVLPRYAVVAADVVSDVANHPAEDRLPRIAATLSQWRWFWDVDPEGLSPADAVGLFGELWFLTRWVGASSESVAAWAASEGARHDFQWPDFSVEVKTTTNLGSPRHRINSLGQLEDAETGNLFLFSLRISRDRLAQNTLGSLVRAITTALVRDPQALATFQSRLGVRGYTPANRGLSARGYRIAGEALYLVTDGFPRLTHAMLGDLLPHGVGGISYELEMSACEPWLRTTTSDAWPLDGFS